MKKSIFALLTASAIMLAACQEEPVEQKKEEKGNLMTEKEIETETYAGGILGTTFNASASAFQDPTPAVEKAGLTNQFMYGEYFFERTYTINTAPFNGLGPVYVRSSCIDCHPGYGYGKRTTKYSANEYGNGYLLVVYDKATDAYVTSVTGMPQTKSVAPFKEPIDENKIRIEWLSYTDEWDNHFPDGESYDLIYPEVTIPLDAFYGGTVQAKRDGQVVDLQEGEYGVRLESTIGIYGTGLLDAIPADSLKAQYAYEESIGAKLNPAIFKDGEWTSQYANTVQGDGTPVPKKFTYALSRGSIEDGPGANAIWNITNVTRSDRRYHYITGFYAQTSASDPEVQKDFYKYYPEYNVTGNPGTDIYNYLMSNTLEPEMSDEDYTNFMIWHRGLAVPAARNLTDATVQRGRQLFREIGCASCHRPSWQTDEDNFYDPTLFFEQGKVLPTYPFQTIWPYTDMVQHRLYMENDIRTGWCRTTPLWGRGLSLIVSGHQDRMHDRRARNVVEAIMWHGSERSDARWTVERFRQLSAEDRAAVVEFINSI